MKAAIGAAVLVVLLVIGAAYWLGHKTSPAVGPVMPVEQVAIAQGEGASPLMPESSSAADSAPSTAEAVSDAGTGASVPVAVLPTVPAAPLPLLDAPLANIVDDLRHRADNGDARAACRLAAELRKCELVDVQLAFVQRLEGQRQAVNQEGMTDDRRRQRLGEFADQQYRDALAASEHCKGAPASTPTEQIHYWRQAAMAGHLPSMTMYATGNAFRYRNSLTQLQDLEVYRHEAEGLARRAAFAGDNEALMALAAAYAPQQDLFVSSLLGQATGTNPVEELAMLLLAQKRGVQQSRQRQRGPMFERNQRSLDDAIAEARGRIEPEQALHAEQLASERAAQFAAPAGASATEHELPDMPFDFDGERQRCDANTFAPVAPVPASG